MVSGNMTYNERKESLLTNHNIADKIISGSEDVAEIKRLGYLFSQPIEKEFGKLKSHEIVITDERIQHIKQKHAADYELFEKYGAETVENPDEIIVDEKNENTVYVVKHLEKTNLNVVAKLILEKDNSDYLNSVMTFYRLRDKNLKKLKNKFKTIYSKE